MALSSVIRHGGVKPEYLDKNPGDVIPVRPQDCDSGCQESSAAGRKERVLPPHFGAGRRQHPCNRQRDNIFPCSAILGSDDPVIFPNIFLAYPYGILYQSFGHGVGGSWNTLGRLGEERSNLILPQFWQVA